MENDIGNDSGSSLREVGPSKYVDFMHGLCRAFGLYDLLNCDIAAAELSDHKSRYSFHFCRHRRSVESQPATTCSVNGNRTGARSNPQAYLSVNSGVFLHLALLYHHLSKPQAPS